MRPLKHVVHFSKPGAAKGFPWTIHVNGVCLQAIEVNVYTPVKTVFKPQKKNNPRAWIETKGYLVYLGQGCYTIRSEP